MSAAAADDTANKPGPQPATWRRRGRSAVRIACGLALTAVAALAIVRLTGLDAGTLLAVPIAGLPYAAVGTAVLLGVFSSARSWRSALVAAVLAVTQLVWLAPRFMADGRRLPAGAPVLRVATSNTHRGGIDPAALVELARSARVDVLAVQESTTEGLRALDAAGMRELMPHRELHPEVDSSIYSRLPLTSGGLLHQPTTWPSTTAEVTIGTRTVRLVAVHTYYPSGDPDRCARDLRALRSATGRDVVMLGDFNATLDHAPMRDLLAAGLVDTHEELGRGWAPTWPVQSALPPLVQIDHILHGSGLVAISASEHTLPGTDHRAVVAELGLLIE